MGGVKSGGGGGQGLKEIKESKQFTSKHLLKAHPPLCPPFQSWIARTPPPSDLVPFAAQSPSPATRFGTWTTYDKNHIAPGWGSGATRGVLHICACAIGKRILEASLLSVLSP